MPKIILKGHILVPEADLDTVKTALTTHIKLTKDEPGNLVFNVIQDEDKLNKFHVYEEFINQAAFESHQQRVKQSHWGVVTTSVERHYEIIEES